MQQSICLYLVSIEWTLGIGHSRLHQIQKETTTKINCFYTLKCIPIGTSEFKTRNSSNLWHFTLINASI